VQELQLGRARWELEEAEGGSQCLATMLFDEAGLGGGRRKSLARSDAGGGSSARSA
jgi:hypothetical protein